MNFKMFDQEDVTKYDTWNIHTKDVGGVLTAAEQAVYTDDTAFRAMFHARVVEALVRSLLDSGAVQIETEYDVMRQESMYAARLRYLVEDET